MSGGLYLSAGVILDENSRVRAAVGPQGHVAVHVDGGAVGGSLSIQIARGGVDQLVVADRLLAAVTEWHAEIHRRGHAEPVKPAEPAPEPASP